MSVTLMATAAVAVMPTMSVAVIATEYEALRSWSIVAPVLTVIAPLLEPRLKSSLNAVPSAKPTETE